VRFAAALSPAGICLLLVMLLTAAGCSKTASKKSTPAADGGDAEAAVADSEAEGVDFDTAIAVDGERVEVCSPVGWTRGPQSKSYLVKYIPSRKKTYPSIVVMAADAPEGIAEVDAGSQKDFVAAIAASLAGTFSKNGKSTLLKKPAAARLGPHFGATWAAPATINVDGVRETIDRSSYAVIIDGRMYTVEVRAPKGKLDGEGRAALHYSAWNGLVQPTLVLIAAGASVDVRSGDRRSTPLHLACGMNKASVVLALLQQT
jgi:hypothetical protein